MFDIGSMELFLVGVIALVVVGPRELPALLRAVGSVTRSVRRAVDEVRFGMDTLAREVAEEADPFKEERNREGLTPGMSPEEITEKILKNRGQGEPSIAGGTADLAPQERPEGQEDGEDKKAAKRTSSKDKTEGGA